VLTQVFFTVTSIAEQVPCYSWRLCLFHASLFSCVTSGDRS
jgi:hypothetical protein